MPDYNKYIRSTGTHYISNSGHDENGKYHGGKAGDSTGHEWELRKWYSRPWNFMLRMSDQNAALKAAQLAIDAALNNNIGYDQYQRTTFWTQLANVGYQPYKISVPCEADCSAGVSAIYKAVGMLIGNAKLQAIPIDTYTGNLRSRFKTAGFEVFTESKYTSSGDYLLPGDVLLYENHHVAINLTIGRKATGWNPSDGFASPPATQFAILRKGSKGTAVKTLQKNLITLGYKLPLYGADGDFGEETAVALKAFQRDNKLDVDGEYGPKSDAVMKKLLTAIAPQKVRVTGGTVNIRTAPNTSGKILGTVKKGATLEYQGMTQDGWHLIVFAGQNAWISGKYAVIDR